MTDHDQSLVQSVVTTAAVGGFVFIALAGWVLAFDVSAIATLIASAADRELLSALFIGGALTKGVVIGIAFGLTSAVLNRRVWRPRAALIAAPANS